jgi:hypothetical protein
MENVTFDDDLERAMTDTDLSAYGQLGRVFASLNKPSATIKRRPVGSHDPKRRCQGKGGRPGRYTPPIEAALRRGEARRVSLRRASRSPRWYWPLLVDSTVNEILHDDDGGGGGDGDDDDERRALELTPAAPNPERSCRSAYDRSIGG